MKLTLTGWTSTMVVLSSLLLFRGKVHGFRVASSSSSSLRASRSYRRSALDSTSSSTISHFLTEQNDFITNVAKYSPPKRLPALLEALQLQGETLVSPRSRKGLNPFLIPLSKNPTDGSMTCLIRWPTQKTDMDLQVVKTNEVGITLLALSTDKFVHRTLVEFDFFGNKAAPVLESIANHEGNSKLYSLGDYLSFMMSGKFPTITDQERRLFIDRYLLSKVGPFPDCYERLATNFVEKNNEVSALVTCERAVSVFYGWGRPMSVHARLLEKLGRSIEAKDTARAALASPKWTIAQSKQELDKITKLAGFSDMKIVGEMHAFRAADPRKKEVEEENLSPLQVTLDQAAHLMDAVAMGAVECGWDAIRQDLATKYQEGGYPDMAAFIRATD